MRVHMICSRVRALGSSSRGLAASAHNLFPGVKRLTDKVVVSASGSYVHTADGEKLLDFTTGIGVTATGHCHPAIARAVAEQAANAVHVQQSCYLSSTVLELVDALLPKVRPVLHGCANPPSATDDADDDAAFFFANSGAEAVEGALRLARQATGRPLVVCFQGGYHGRTAGSLSATSSSNAFRGGAAGPLAPGFAFAPFPFRSQLGSAFDALDDAELSAHCLEQLRLMLRQQVAASEVAALLVEPVLGEGGYVQAPAAFLHGLREVCDDTGALFIADEVQTGFGRTGRTFAMEHSGVRPDVLVMAKGIASGYPLSAVACRKELARQQVPGSMGGTYGGNAVACAAALATQRVYEEEGIEANVEARGVQLREALRRVAEALPAARVKDVRGPGLMLAIEFDREPGFAGRVSQACLRRGLLVLTTSVFEVLRFIPPLTLSEAEAAEASDIFADALSEVTSPA